MIESNRPSWRTLLSENQPLVLPGAYDALSAKLVERAGFDAFVIGGFPLLGSRYGLPDIGLAGLGEMVAGVVDILRATTLPVLVDADHGYGDVRNVTRTVRTYEELGVAALLLEDQRMPKRCGHAAGKSVIPVLEMEAKVRAAAAARDDPSLFLIARTDARATNGLDDALRRAERYILAGADGIFVEAPQSEDELVKIAHAFDVPQVCNMLVGGLTPILTNRELHAMGFQMIVHGTTLIKRVARVLEQTLSQLRDDTLNCDPEDFVTLAEFMQINDVQDWADIEASFAPKHSESL